MYGIPTNYSAFSREENSLDGVCHINIAGDDVLRNCINRFSGVTELTLSGPFSDLIDQTVAGLTRILPLTTLTRLSINDRSFLFEQVIDLLVYLPNIHTLKIAHTAFYTADFVYKKKHEQIQQISSRNLIRTLTTESQCNAEQMKLLLHLFPRLQHITMNIFWNDFSAIFQLMFSTMKDKTRDLFSICLENESKESMRRLTDLRQKMNWIDCSFSMKFIDDRLYIWW